MVVLMRSDLEARCSWNFAKSENSREDIVSGSKFGSAHGLVGYREEGGRRTVILGWCLVHKEANFVHQLLPPSVDGTEMVIVVCRAFLQDLHTLFELLLLALEFFELSNDGVLLNNLNAQSQSASPFFTFLSARGHSPRGRPASSNWPCRTWARRQRRWNWLRW